MLCKRHESERPAHAPGGRDAARLRTCRASSVCFCTEKEGRRMRKAASLRPSRRVRHVARPHTGLWNPRYARYPGSRLRSGHPTAQITFRLVLLGSPPDTVHGATLRGTDPSSLLTGVRRHSAVPGAGIHPCCSGLQVQGTANSPTSAALPQAGRSCAPFGRLYLISYIISRHLSISLFTFFKKGLYNRSIYAIMSGCQFEKGL